MSRAPGRPRRDGAPVSRQRILAAALALLDVRGGEAFTMRALAARLGVTPMTIYHHFGDRDGLIEAMSDSVYADVAPPDTGTPRDRIAGLLRAYHDRVLRHPGLTLLIFLQPSVFPRQAQRITDDIRRLLADTGLPARQAGPWLNILVDFTHGAAVATAMGNRTRPGGTAAQAEFATALDTLMQALGR